LGFEIQELPDIIRVIVLLNLSEGKTSHKTLLKNQIDKVCMDYVCVEMSNLEKTLNDMPSDGLVLYNDGSVQLTEQGIKLGKEGQSLLLKKEPILETVEGLLDGSSAQRRGDLAELNHLLIASSTLPAYRTGVDAPVSCICP
jgi:DNA-binding PadR family transcriptional regulator